MTIYRDVVRGSPIWEHTNQIFRLIALYARGVHGFDPRPPSPLRGDLNSQLVSAIEVSISAPLLHIVALINCMISLFRKLHSKAMFGNIFD